MRKSLEEVAVHKAEIVHELIQVYSSIESGAESAEKGIAKCKADMDDILRRKDPSPGLEALTAGLRTRSSVRGIIGLTRNWRQAAAAAPGAGSREAEEQRHDAVH